VNGPREALMGTQIATALATADVNINALIVIFISFTMPKRNGLT
jgi:hypothetical protein